MTRIGYKKGTTSCHKSDPDLPCGGGELGQLVEMFEREWVPSLVAELKFYEQQPSLEEVIRVATEKGHSHLTRISPATLEIARRRLLNSSRLRGKFSDFEQLYAAVEAEIESVHGIGLLTVYDVAHRAGAFLKLEPQMVYLQRGSKQGAQILGVGRGKRKVEKQAFPVELHRLRAPFIEDFLCICREDLLHLKVSNPADQADS